MILAIKYLSQNERNEYFSACSVFLTLFILYTHFHREHFKFFTITYRGVIVVEEIKEFYRIRTGIPDGLIRTLLFISFRYPWETVKEI